MSNSNAIKMTGFVKSKVL